MRPEIREELQTLVKAMPNSTCQEISKLSYFNLDHYGYFEAAQDGIVTEWFALSKSHWNQLRHSLEMKSDQRVFIVDGPLSSATSCASLNYFFGVTYLPITEEPSQQQYFNIFRNISSFMGYQTSRMHAINVAAYFNDESKFQLLMSKNPKYIFVDNRYWDVSRQVKLKMYMGFIFNNFDAIIITMIDVDPLGIIYTRKETIQFSTDILCHKGPDISQFFIYRQE